MTNVLSPTGPATRRPPSVMDHCRLACGGLLMTAFSASAEDAVPAPTFRDKVEVTGSRIARIDSETALPVQVMTREDILRAGFTTAAELLAHLPAAFNGANDQLSVGNVSTPGL